MRDADRVRDLKLGAVGETGGDHVLGDVAGGVRGAAVDLRRILAAERAATVTRHPAVGVDDDLPAGQTAVAHRPADHEPARRIHEQVAAELLGVEQVIGHLGLDDVLPQVLLEQRLGAVAVLGRDQDLLDLDGAAVDIAHGHLRLPVRTEIGQDLGTAHVREPLGQLVRERDRQRHQLLGLVRRVPEHHPLIAGAGEVELVAVRRVSVGARLVRLIHALGDVGRLLVDRVDHRARVVVEAELGVRVADPLDRLPRDLRNVHVRRRCDLAGNHDEAGVYERLAGHAAIRIVAQHRVEHPVGDLVSDLVRMALGHRLGREQVLVVGVGHGFLLSLSLRVISSR